MLDFMVQYWVLISAAAAGVAWMTNLSWKLRTLEKDRTMCEVRCLKRVEDLYAAYGDDVKEIKDDLKGTKQAVQDMNLSLTSLIAFLRGKGVTPQ